MKGWAVFNHKNFALSIDPSNYSSVARNARSHKLEGASSGVAATSTTGTGLRATENQFLSCFVHSKAKSNSNSELGLKDCICSELREFKKKPTIQAWLKSSPRSELKNRKVACEWILKGYTSLCELKLTSIPEDVSQIFQNAKELDLSQNSIKSLPESIGKLQNLETLYLYSNPLQSVPIKSFEQLHKLEALILDADPNLPERIGHLEKRREKVGQETYRRAKVISPPDNDKVKMQHNTVNKNCLGSQIHRQPIGKPKLLSGRGQSRLF